MDTLSDVNTRRGGKISSSIGFVSSVLPKAISSQTGVSIRYAYNPDKQWYVLRVSYGREKRAYDFITNEGTEAFLPMHHVVRQVGGNRRRMSEPLIPNILFVYSTFDKVEEYVKRTTALTFVSYYYDHFKKMNNGKNPPLTVGYEEMINFINLTNVDSDHIKLVEAKECRFKSGDMVVVTDGPFKGTKGKVARVAGQQRVIVELNGLCMIATAYIPTAFIKSVK